MTNAPVSDTDTRRAFHLELMRAAPSGTIEAFATTFLLLIALRHFGVPTGWKAAIAAAGNAGLLAAPAALSWAARRGIPANVAISRLFAFGAVAAVAPLVFPTSAVFVVASLVAFGCNGSHWGLIQTIYASAFPATRRGQLLSVTIGVKFATAALVGVGLGKVLGRDAEQWWWAQVLLLVCFVSSAVLVRRLPAAAVAEPAGADVHPWHRRMELLRSDRTLRNTLTSWMLMGFANLMMIPLRVEFLANERYGVNATAAKVGLLTVTIPAVLKVALAPVFGWVFDHLPFFVVRIMVNVGFAASIIAFFSGDSTFGLVLGAVIFGVAAAGGDVLWSLWTIRLAAPEHMADYAALHTFTTGIRGVAAPFVGLWLLDHDFGPRSVGTVCAVLILAASAVLIPDMRAERARLRAAGVATA